MALLQNAVQDIPQLSTTRNEQGVTVMGYIWMTLNAQDWLQGEPDRMVVRVSLSLLNGGTFPIDDIPAEFRSILVQEHEIELNS